MHVGYVTGHGQLRVKTTLTSWWEMLFCLSFNGARGLPIYCSKFIAKSRYLLSCGCSWSSGRVTLLRMCGSYFRRIKNAREPVIRRYEVLVIWWGGQTVFCNVLSNTNNENNNPYTHRNTTTKWHKITVLIIYSNSASPRGARTMQAKICGSKYCKRKQPSCGLVCPI